MANPGTQDPPTNLFLPLNGGLLPNTPIPGLNQGVRVKTLAFAIPAGAVVNIHYGNQPGGGFPVNNQEYLNFDCPMDCGITFDAVAFAGTMIVQVWSGDGTMATVGA